MCVVSVGRVIDRSAPEAGYDFGNKRQYRRTIWATFRKLCVGSLADSHALLMPSSEGDEIDVALNNGFREYNLHVVDWNPAIVAHLKRRHPLINTYGCLVSKAGERIARSGIKLSVANLDLCNQISAARTVEIETFFRNEPMVDGGAAAFTILRGREQGIYRDALKRLLPGHAPQLYADGDLARFLLGACFHCPSSQSGKYWMPLLLRDGIYRSTAGNQTMMWVIARVFCRDREWLDERLAKEDPYTYAKTAPMGR